MTTATTFKIGTRGSPLALWQANTVAARLRETHHLPESAVELVIIKTSGDMIQDRALSQAGGKGLFTKEIDEALLSGAIDCAVHSAKDMPTAFPDGIIITGYLPREDVRDALISPKYKTLDALPENGIVGTASLRRAALIKKLRPDLQTTLLRGNVETRLRKANDGEVDATLLALAGLKRLGLADRATMLLPIDVFPPAVGQGAVAITSRTKDQRMLDAIDKIAHKATGLALAAERAFLTVLDGSCRTPIAGHATIDGDTLNMRGLFLSLDGTKAYGAEAKGSVNDAAMIGEKIAREILQRVPKEVLAQLA